MATNDFLVFGGGSSPNVIDQATYAALTARLSGFQSGTALSAQLNKVWRQSSIMAAVLAQFTANFSGQNSVDDGTIATLLANLQAAINAAGITAPQFDNTAKLATTAFVQRALGNFNGFVQYSAAATMANSTIGAYVQTVTNAFTLTVPSPVSVPGGLIAFWNNNSNPVTLSTLVGKFYGGLGTATSTYVMQPQECIVIATDGINWCVNESTLRGNTAAQFDNSTMLATTAFTQRALGNYRSARGYVGNATLSATDIGAMITWDGNGTLTLPDATAFPGGAAIRVFKYAGPIASVLAANKPGQMNVPTSGADTYTFAVGVYGFFELINESSMKWDVAGELFNQFGTTAAAGDNSTRLATTAFVKQAGESFSGIQGINATASLNGGHVGAFLWAYGAGITLTLPPVAGVPNGATITIATPVGITVKGNGTENINNQSGGLSNTFALNAGEQAQFVSNTGAWYLSSYTTVLGTTPSQFDNSNKLATTEFVQRAVGAVVGSMRNAAMGVPVASASATFTADEVVVETALGGAAFRIANFNKTINLATTGAGGMDTGSAPVSGFVALYAIYNPTTGASALLARNATSAVQPNVYGGGNMPAGYTASALVSVWQTTSGGLLNVGSQFDRVISTPGFTVLSTTTQAGSYTSFSISGGVPPNAKTARGYQSITGNTASAGLSSSIAGSASGIGAAGQAATMPTNSASVTTPFPHIPLVTPQTLYYLAAASSGTLTFVVGVYEYTF
ncbi:hypothetical protein [Burkholderia cepacia]|uniref:hypothetical protein n=1 Tax=Burkholderia cepacia TaxID=292 RepID=UPI001CF10105|nr:hypothetical protein [Burkholderia cepacia]MCA8113927.1 hypothetical protein [Burkholderia cepacia]MCA8400557.1 hypothetical protein [Burkholderia cepacia]